MPTNFTVVPVDDAEGGSHSSAAAGSAKPSTLGQLFREEQDGDSSPETLTGSVRHFLSFFKKKKKKKVLHKLYGNPF